MFTQQRKLALGVALLLVSVVAAGCVTTTPVTQTDTQVSSPLDRPAPPIFGGEGKGNTVSGWVHHLFNPAPSDRDAVCRKAYEDGQADAYDNPFPYVSVKLQGGGSITFSPVLDQIYTTCFLAGLDGEPRPLNPPTPPAFISIEDPLFIQPGDASQVLWRLTSTTGGPEGGEPVNYRITFAFHSGTKVRLVTLPPPANTEVHAVPTFDAVDDLPNFLSGVYYYGAYGGLGDAEVSIGMNFLDMSRELKRIILRADAFQIIVTRGFGAESLDIAEEAYPDL
ncbi:hypothetical protein Ocepr_0324 [Oceanithermus profundus DSM 14977]|uniref:Lipoprotein n=1 Tax=Oceanithermus profundus (strain DSM 14977 / NBRC 100410 / VKM B-2274 / 506) TaxID=670487 RepID=E4U6P6_OCEP5|nr:hypothetical protein [Oceanithermus profundus]ADR35784.1 hypothetical protein Ocepr_0324 [Oceanithermus profundus DSM 14977]